MKGSVRKKGATWSFRIDLGKIDGKRKQIERSGFQTEKEADAALAAALNEFNSTGELVEDKKITFQQVYDDFLENEAPITRKYATIVRYKSIYRNHFEEDIAPRYIGSISSDYLQKFVNSKTESLSNEYVRGLYNFLLVIFGYAKKKKCLKNNPMDDVSPPASYRSYGQIETYTKEELDKMESRFASTNLLTCFLLGRNLGLRVGECFALRFSNIDWEKETIRIDKQLQYQNKIWCFIPPKTSSGVRTIKLNKKLINYLKELQERYRLDRIEYQDGYKINTIKDCCKKKHEILVIDDFINRKPNGEMLYTNSDRVLARICKKEFNIDFKYHNLRHTHATMLAEQGVNPKYVQQRLGHSKIEITLRYYTHVTDLMHDQVANIVDEIS